MSTPGAFIWGPIAVEPLMAVPRRGGVYRALRVRHVNRTRGALEIYVSPTGRSVRVFRDGVELVARR